MLESRLVTIIWLFIKDAGFWRGQLFIIVNENVLSTKGAHLSIKDRYNTVIGSCYLWLPDEEAIS